MSVSEYIIFVQKEYYHPLYKKGKMTYLLEDKINDWIEQYRNIMS